MIKLHKMIGILVLITSLVWITACSTINPTPAPTQDVNPLRTEVAATVLAQVTLTLAAMPTDTAFPSPTATFTLSPTANESLTITPVVTVTLVAGTPVTTTVNQAIWVSQSIADDSIFAPGEVFTMTWRLRNVGTSTWTEGYMLRYYSGETFGAPDEVLLGRVVLPGEEVDITITMKAPIVPGDYRTDWVMATESRSNFKEQVFLRIRVVRPPTVTPTPTTSPPTATPGS